MSVIYRKRLIPDECVCLNNDTILEQTDSSLITYWSTLHPKNEFAKGISYYDLKNGWKISKFYTINNSLVYIYCDIIDYTYDCKKDTYIFTDLLADVIIENNGAVKVVDLAELADAYACNIISKEIMLEALTKLDNLLTIIYNHQIDHYINIINEKEQFIH